MSGAFLVLGVFCVVSFRRTGALWFAGAGALWALMSIYETFRTFRRPRERTCGRRLDGGI